MLGEMLMGSWQPMDTAPKDGTPVIGRDKSGQEAEIQFRSVHEMLPGSWFTGTVEVQGSWEAYNCFYPVEWRAVKGK